jgi:hypothetical protein
MAKGRVRWVQVSEVGIAVARPCPHSVANARNRTRGDGGIFRRGCRKMLKVLKSRGEGAGRGACEGRTPASERWDRNEGRPGPERCGALSGHGVVRKRRCFCTEPLSPRRGGRALTPLPGPATRRLPCGSVPRVLRTARPALGRSPLCGFDDRGVARRASGPGRWRRCNHPGPAECAVVGPGRFPPLPIKTDRATPNGTPFRQ